MRGSVAALGGQPKRPFHLGPARFRPPPRRWRWAVKVSNSLLVPTSATARVVGGGGASAAWGGAARLCGRPAAASPLLASGAWAAALAGGGRPERLVFRGGRSLSGPQPRPPSRRFAPRTLPQRDGGVAATASSSAVG